MKNSFFAILFFLLLLLSSCSDDDNGITEIQLAEGIAGFTTINYQYLATAPIHTQTIMLTGHNNKLYRYGSRWPMQILDLNSKTWTNIDLPDDTFSRWDGAAVTIEDSIYIVSQAGTLDYKDIIKFDISTNTLSHSGIDLPKGFNYPAYCVNAKKIVFFSTATDSVYEYNTATKVLQKVALNPYYKANVFNAVLSSGIFQHYLYVYGPHHYFSEAKFRRLNLNNYEWEELAIPEVVAEEIVDGSSYGNNFIFFSDTSTTYKYLFEENEWYIDTSKSQIYTRNLIGELSRCELSFYSTDTCLYCTGNFADNVWKIK